MPPPQAPTKPVSETLNYKDAPDDIRRQIEAKAGLQPSQDGEMTEGQSGDPKMQSAPAAKGNTSKPKRPSPQSAAAENPS